MCLAFYLLICSCFCFLAVSFADLSLALNKVAVWWLLAFTLHRTTRQWPDLEKVPAVDLDVDVDHVLQEVMDDPENGFRDKHGSGEKFRVF